MISIWKAHADSTWDKLDELRMRCHMSPYWKDMGLTTKEHVGIAHEKYMYYVEVR